MASGPEELQSSQAIIDWAEKEVERHSDNAFRKTSAQIALGNEIKAIQELDPNHPTMTMLAGIGKDTVEFIKTRAPDLDLLGIQMYADIVNLAGARPVPVPCPENNRFKLRPEDLAAAITPRTSP